MNIAHAILNVKSIDESDDFYTIKGIATTPTVDRTGDIVEPMGARFKLPIPLLWQHDSKKSIGNVVFAEQTKDGIPFKAEIPKIKEPGIVKDRIDEAIHSLKYRLVAGASIGFKEIAGKVESLKSGGLHFLEWLWLELSLVTIPANAEATITSIKSLDDQQRAASGNAPGPVVRLTPPGATGQPPKGKIMKPIAEQITGFEAKRAAHVGRNEEIMSKSAEEGRTLNETEQQEYDGLATEMKSIDAHLVRLREHEKSLIAKAVQVTPASTATPEAATAARQGVITMGGNNLPKGTAFVRYAMALASSRGNLMQAAELAKGWKDSTPEVEIVLKAAVAAGTTAHATWAAPLVVATSMASEFIELLRPETLLGRMPGVRRVPFNISMARTTAGSSSQWVGEGKPKPVSAMAFETITLGFTKIATIVVLTEETVRFSNPAAEALVSADMRAAIAQYSDQQFIDSTVTASANLRPAAITNGATTYAITGTTIAAVTTDISKLFAYFSTNNISLAGAVFVMHPSTALFLSMLRTTQDVFAFPGMGMMGGSFFGVPVITSNSAPVDTGDDKKIWLISTPNILLADDGDVTLDVSREASLQMDSAPSDAASSLVSLWQSNMVGLRAERFINYRKRRDAAVVGLTGVSY